MLFTSEVHAQQLTLANNRIVISSPAVIPENAAPLNWINSALGPDGSIYLADMYTGQIVKLSSTGERLWVSGGEGEGPGEFEGLYRLAVNPDGRLLAYDLSRNELSIFTSDGVFQRRDLLEFRLRQVDTVLWPNDTTFILAGTADSRGTGPASTENGLHHADEDFRYVSSFGSLPTAEDRYILNFWGAGVTTFTPDGKILYTVRNPYDVYLYSADGTFIDSMTVQVPVKGRSDDRFKISRTPAFSVASTDAVVTVPVGTFRLGPQLFLGGRIEGDRRYWTVFDSDGSVLDDVPVPEWGGIIIAVDLGKENVWMRLRDDLGVAHLVLAHVDIAGAASLRTAEE